MLIIDDIVLAPISGVLWIVRQVYEAARQELAAEAETITAELMDLHMLLESGAITSELFDAREKKLLDRLDEIEERGVRVRDEASE